MQKRVYYFRGYAVRFAIAVARPVPGSFSSAFDVTYFDDNLMSDKLRKISTKELKRLLELNRDFAASWGARGRYCDLRSTDLRGRDFRGYDLRWVDFSCSNLRDTNFTGCDTRAAKFSWADLTGARGLDLEMVVRCGGHDGARFPRRVHLEMFGRHPPKPSVKRPRSQFGKRPRTIPRPRYIME